MGIRIYGGVAGSRAFRNIWMLEELGLPYENVPVHFGSDETRTPAYLALNPNGRVPTLVDGDIVLWESIAINLYLARRYDGGLQPKSPAGDASVLKWSVWAVAEIDAPHDAAMRVGSTISAADLRRAFHILDDNLKGREYLVDDRFTVADLNVASIVARPTLPLLISNEFPEIERWRGACLSRRACIRAFEVVTTEHPKTKEAGND